VLKDSLKRKAANMQAVTTTSRKPAGQRAYGEQHLLDGGSLACRSSGDATGMLTLDPPRRAVYLQRHAVFEVVGGHGPRRAHAQLPPARPSLLCWLRGVTAAADQ